MRMLIEILKELKRMTAAMQSLTTAANTLTATIANSVTLIGQLAAEKEDPVALAALAKQITTANTDLAAANLAAQGGTPTP